MQAPTEVSKVRVDQAGAIYINGRAATLGDLAASRGNNLEALKGDRRGQHAIRVNDQWRICFVWTPDGPKDVEFVDYH